MARRQGAEKGDRRPGKNHQYRYLNMKHTLFMAAALLATVGLSAQNEKTPAKGPDRVVKIWDNTTAPHSNGITTPEVGSASGRVGNVSEATLFIFKADPSKAAGQAVVICPGGGYARLSMEDEGLQMARWFAGNGITAAVLKYRMPEGHREVPLEDAEQALRIMKGEVAGAEGFVEPQVGIAGCSAGGHLAAGHHGRGGQVPQGVVRQSAGRRPDGGADGSLLLAEPRNGGDASGVAAAFGR